MNNVSDNLCRACLTPKESFSYIIFENVSAETFSFCTSIEIKKQENLPNTLCDACFEILTKYSEFKRMCIDSHNTLLFYQNVKVEVKPNFGDSINAIEIEIENNYATKSEDIKEELLPDAFGEDFVRSDCSGTDQNEIDPAGYLSVHKKGKKAIIKATRKDNTKTDQIKNESQNTCELCGKVFKYSKRLKAHVKKHFVEDDDYTDPDNNLTHQCKKCNKSFMTVSGLHRHEENTHTTIPLSSVSCTKCGRVYASKYSLKEHEKMHMHEVKNVHICHICGKKMSSHIILKTHLETHTERERGHTCEHCGKKYFNNRGLVGHITRVHSGVTYICGLCGYGFNDKYNLTKHIQKHEGKKYYKCDICEKPFSSTGTLKEHKRIHSGERPYCCSFCPKRFLSNRRLQDHQKTHTGEKPHKCTICGQSFIQRGSLKRHMKVHDPLRVAL